MIIRIVGFNIIDVGNIKILIVLLFMVFMFIGGVLLSVVGGIKVIIFVIVIIVIFNMICKEKNNFIFNREILERYI